MPRAYRHRQNSPDCHAASSVCVLVLQGSTNMNAPIPPNLEFYANSSTPAYYPDPTSLARLGMFKAANDSKSRFIHKVSSVPLSVV